MKFSNDTYDKLKWVALILIPALAALYCNCAKYVPLPYPDQVVGVLTSLDFFLGTILGISTFNYNKGEYDELDTADESDH